MQELFKIKYNKLASLKKLPPRDQGHYLPFNTYPHGVPLGGFGAGTIGRSPYGDFNIWHIKVGAHIAEELKACCFHSYQKIADEEHVYLNTLTARKFQAKKLEKFAEPFSQRAGHYAAAYPKSKYIFDEKNRPAEIICEQYSPILPHNYRETSYPLAVFEHTVRNKTNKKIEVALMFTWANMTGWSFEDQRPGVQDNWFSFVKNNSDKKHTVKTKNVKTPLIASQQAVGIILGQNKNQVLKEMDGEFAIATIGDKNKKITYQQYFYLEGTGTELYQQFAKDGTLINQYPPRMEEHQNYGAALAVKITLKPYETQTIPFILVWDLPVVHFGKGVNKYKYYTRYFGKTGKNSWQIALAGLQNYQKWSAQIDKWHEDITKNSKINNYIVDPKTRNNYYKMLINELYFLADGGTFWDAESGNFGLLECFDYPFYETLDVRFYGSFPLLKYWPQIELKIMTDFAKLIHAIDKTITRFHHHTDDPTLPLPNKKEERLFCQDYKMIKGACPHDLGSPKENPFDIPAGYTWQNTNYWKDLNTKFVLLCYRNYKYTGDINFLKKVWPAMQEAMTYLQKMDRDKDGIPENSGHPDQTYDNWVMQGVSAYCGSLWLAALSVMITAAVKLSQKQLEEKYTKLLNKAAGNFDKKLWNGNYFDFCQGNNDIMADQLIGQWYLDILNEKPLTSELQIIKTLKTIYKYNYRKTVHGKWGIISGKKRNNRHVEAKQGRDVWVGANFALCALFINHGMTKEASKVLNTLSKIIYDKGFFFRTPEGWDTKGHFTATMYMRPNAVWGLEF